MGLVDRLYPGKSSMHQALGGAALSGLTGLGIGFAEGRYRKKLFGLPAGAVVGLAGTLGFLGIDLFLPSRGKVTRFVHSCAPVLRDMGRVGLGTFTYAAGVGMGAGMGVGDSALAAVNKKDLPALKKAVPNAVIVGAIPPAPRGNWLSQRDLQALT